MDVNDLQIYIDTRFADIQKTIDTRFADIQKAMELHTSIVQGAIDKAEQESSRKQGEIKGYIDMRFADTKTNREKSEDVLSEKFLRRNEHVDTRFIDLQSATHARFADMQKAVDLRTSVVQAAVDKAEIELTKKQEGTKDYIDRRFADAQTALDKVELTLSETFIRRDAHMNTRFIDIQTIVNTHFAAFQLAVDKSEEGMTKRLEGMNEFRAQLKDQAAQFITRGEFAAIQKMVYVGLGAVLALEVLLRFLVK
jgi:hypothetical protein